MTLRYGISLDGSEPPAQALALARIADEAGATAAWVASHLFQREPIATSAMILAGTRTLGIALMAMSPYSVHPVYATMAAATLDEYYPGRVTLCFGVGAPRDLEAAGIVSENPLGTVREAVAVARALLSGGQIKFEGKRYRVSGRSLAGGARDIPIFVAASGPQMLELAGAAADGVLISAATSPQFIRASLDLVRKGEQASGRTIRKTALVYASADKDGGAARNRLRRTIGFVLRGQHHARNLELAGTRLDQAALVQAYAREDWESVDTLITDEVMANHAASGTPDEVRAALAAYQDIGIDEIIASGLCEPDHLASVLEPLGGS
jgi:5,10-methylenetetrahydromethanopterin reductase